MAGASQHDEDMKDLMRTEIFVPGVKNRELQAVNNTTDRINDAAGQKPSKTGSGKGVKNGQKGQDTEPPHADIQYRRYPFGTGNPAGLEDNAQKRNTPYADAEGVAQTVVKGDQADRRIASGDHDKDHHVVEFAKPAVYLLGGIYGMVNGAGCIEKDHGQYENGQSKHMEQI